MTQDTETKVDKVFETPKSMAELQYDLKIKRFYVGETKCYPASLVVDVVATMRQEWKIFAEKEYNRGLANGKTGGKYGENGNDNCYF